MDNFVLASTAFKSRLILGSGKYSSPEVMLDSIKAAAVDMITVAVRRADLEEQNDSFSSLYSNKNITFLPNTSGARNALEAVRCAKIARAGSGSNWVKLEVTPEPTYLLPDPIETYKAAKELIDLGFHVLPYINADPILALQLQDLGCAAVMPLASPIGTNKGLETQDQIAIILEQCSLPVIIDAGLGAPSHACQAMEMGAAAVMVNTAVATAADPIAMSIAFKEAVIAGRKAYLAGIPLTQPKAVASSPLTGFLD